jgi:sulfur-oxidizing protein SoxZ
MTNVLINAPKTAKPGEIVEIKALILHPMETGFRPGTNGKIIPRNIMEMSPAIATNPFVSFFAVATESGTIGLRWTGDEGFLVEEQVAIAVG